jgi:hypothetical protein
MNDVNLSRRSVVQSAAHPLLRRVPLARSTAKLPTSIRHP